MKTRYIFISILLAVAMYSCEEPIGVDLNTEETVRLIVEGGITTDTMAHSIKISKSISFFKDEAPPMETGAIVQITDGATVFPLSETSPGVYHTASDVYGEVGHVYTLSIELQDGEIYTATDSILKLPEIDSIVVKGPEQVFAIFGDTTYYWSIQYNGMEERGKGTGYLWNLYLNDRLYNDTIIETTYVNDDFVDGNYIYDFDIYVIPEMDIIDSLVNVEVEMMSFTDGYYDHLYALFLEVQLSGSTFAGPPANVPSNISNGGLGYFRTSDVKRAKTSFINAFYKN